MKIVVAARCRDGERFVSRFLHGYDFADNFVISDGGSTDKSVELLQQDPKVILHRFEGREELSGGRWWNPDAPHMNFVINKAKELEPDWLIFDDFDCFPNFALRGSARHILENITDKPQVNAFRLYMWGEDEYFPKMNDNFNPRYRSLWAWQPSKINIRVDMNVRHGTIVGTDEEKTYPVELPMCLLHYSWHPDTIDEKLAHYKAVGFPMTHPTQFAGNPKPRPEWAHP